MTVQHNSLTRKSRWGYYLVLHHFRLFPLTDSQFAAVTAHLFALNRKMPFRNLLLQYKSILSISNILYWTNWLLAGLLVWLCGTLAAGIMENWALNAPESRKKYIPPKSVKRDIPQPYGNFKAIVDMNVFDMEVSTQAAPKEEVVIKPVDDLLQKILPELTLTGTYKSRNNYCIIKDSKTNKEDIFEVGDQVFQTGAVVDKIVIEKLRKAVYIRINEEVGVLELESMIDKDELLETDGQASAAVERRQPQKELPEPGRRQIGEYPSTTGDGGNRDFFLRTDEVQRHIKDFATLINQAKVVPYIKDGQNMGYTIKNITKGSLYEKLGLRNFDIIQRINGNAVDSMEKAIEMFNTLKNEREITINILRGETPLSFNYHIN